MRVLMLQSCYETSRDVSGLSEWNLHLDIIRALAAAKAPVFFYVPIPKKTTRFTYDDELFNLPNVQLLEYDFKSYFQMPSEWLKWTSVYRNLPFEVVWNDCWWHNVVLAVTLRSSINGTPPTLINTFYESPRAPELVAHSGVPLVDFQMIGGALNDHSVVLSPYHRDLFMEIARQYVGGSVLASLRDRVDVLFPAVELAKIDVYRTRYEEERQKREELNVMLAGGLSEGKRRFLDIAKIVKRLADVGYPIRLVVRTQSSAGHSNGKKLLDLGASIKFECTQAEYLYDLGEADVVVDFTQDETTGLANIEAVLSGTAYIPIRGPWMRDRIPREYQLAMSGASEIEAILAIFSKNKAAFLEKFSDEIANLEATYRIQHDSTNVSRQFMTIVGKAVSRQKEHFATGQILRLVQTAVAGHDRLTLSELYEQMRLRSKSQFVNWGVGLKYWNALIAMRTMRFLGFTDVCDGPEPVFVRQEQMEVSD